MMSGLGDTSAPSTDAVSSNGVKAVSEVRRASTVTSHTPGNGSVTVRL
jgi:hypothetical protein